VLIRILASTVRSADWRARSLTLPPGFGLLGRLVFGFLRPRQPILGTELAGIVDSIGRDVTRFRPGDEVIAFTGGRFGSHAEYRTMPEDGMLAVKPANLTFEEAAALSFGGVHALTFLRDRAGLARGDRVLVIGASGAIGTAAIQVARHLGAEVTAVTSTGNATLVTSIGADRVIDYTRVDFTTTGETWGIIFDTTGTVSFSRCASSLKPGGRLVAVSGSFAQWLGIGRPSKASGKKVITGVAAVRPDHLRHVAQLASEGALRPVVDRVYRLEDAAEAHSYVDTGRKRGSVVLAVATGQDDTRMVAANARPARPADSAKVGISPVACAEPGGSGNPRIHRVDRCRRGCAPDQPPVPNMTGIWVSRSEPIIAARRPAPITGNEPSRSIARPAGTPVSAATAGPTDITIPVSTGSRPSTPPR
jgi:NADPH:quinone reductase-like Zn-dependent oxidoreductase